MQKTYRCIIVDDDEIDRLCTVSFVKRHPQLSIAGIFTNAADALASIHTGLPDIAFFDIDMPGMSGLELRKQADKIPVCIFITSYADYAVDGFDLAALDFIVKPVAAERFEKTVKRILNYLDVKDKAAQLEVASGSHERYITEGHRQVKINLNDVLYLEALKDYTSIVTASKKYCVYGALGNIIKENTFQSFIRIHRSYAVQKNKIEKLANGMLWTNGMELPVGRSFKNDIAMQLNK